MTEPRPAARDKLFTALGAASVVAVVLFCALSPIWEMDVFWHVAVGRWILDHHALPTQNVWSAADPTQPYHPAQWLWEAIAAWLDRHGGLEALRIENAAWITGTFVLLYALLRRTEKATIAALLTLLVFAAFHDRVRVRPHVVNLTGEVLLTYAAATLARPRRIHFAFAFVGFFLWASLHAGGAWIMGGVLAGFAIIVLVLERRAGAGSDREAWVVLALCGLVGCALSPHSLRWIQVHDDAAMSYVEEWRAWPALVSMGPYKLPHVILTRLFFPVAVIGWIALAVAWLRSSKEVRATLAVPRELVWSLALIALSATAWRFFYLAGLALVALWLGKRRLDAARNITPSRSPVRLALAIGVSAVVAGVTLHYECVDYNTYAEAWGSRRDTVDDRYFPTLGTQLLVESRLSARVATFPNWGGYVSYYGFPRLRTTIDGRFIAPDEVKAISEEILNIYETGQHTERLSDRFDRLPADFLLLPRGGRYTQRLSLLHWAKVATGPVEDLWIRKTPESIDWVHTLRVVIERHRLANIPDHHFE